MACPILKIYCRLQQNELFCHLCKSDENFFRVCKRFFKNWALRGLSLYFMKKLYWMYFGIAYMYSIICPIHGECKKKLHKILIRLYKTLWLYFLTDCFFLMMRQICPALVCSSVEVRCILMYALR